MLKNKIFIFFLLALLFLLTPETSFSQRKLEVFGQLKSELPDLKTGEIRIQEDDGIFQKIKFSRSGKFELALPLGHIYTFEFSQPGCISKQIEISTHCPEAHEETVFDPFHFSVLLEIYSETPSIDTLFYDRPVGKVYFDETYQKFGYDREYILFVQNTIREAVERQLMASIDRDNQSERLEAMNTLLSKVDSLGVQGKHILADFEPDSAYASVMEETPIADSTNEADLAQEELAVALVDNTQEVANKKETPPVINANELILKSPVNTETDTFRTALALSEARSTAQEPANLPEKAEIKVTTPTNKAEVPVGPVTKNEVKQAPDKTIKTTEQNTLKEPERKIRPKESTITTEPQFKKRPERKTFENMKYPTGLWTRIFINDGSSVTKYTMIQYDTGKTAYYKQEQYQSDSLQISRSIFMRVIK